MSPKTVKIFWLPAVVTAAVAMLVAVFVGPSAALIAGLLIILEITFSFENAVINAKMLQRLSPTWQKVFMTVGIAIAVFGMRIIFPLVLVGLTSHLSIGDVYQLAVNEPEQYSSQLEASMPQIAAFGSAFLLMVFWHFFVYENKRPFWFRPFERLSAALPSHWSVPMLLSLSISLLGDWLLAPQNFNALAVASSIGILTHLVIHGLIELLESRQLAKSATKLVGWSGLVGFLYLEVLDASFSFDGVIGAFAITDSVVLIAAGLGAGAVWVRSMTVFLVRHNTLARFDFLEQGAHYAIGLLALVLLIGLRLHVPEVVTGLAGVGIIGLSLLASHHRNLAKRSA